MNHRNTKHLLTLTLLSFFLIFTIQISFGQLSGQYIVDQSGAGDFLTIQEAADALKAEGVDNSVTLQLASGTYNEKTLFDSIPGNSSVNQIIIESQSGNKDDVIITYTINDQDTSNYVIRLNSTKGVAIRNITFDTQDATSDYGRVVELKGNVENTIIENCTFLGNRNSSAIEFGSLAGGFNFFQTNNCKSLAVTGNLFKYFSPAISAQQDFLFAAVNEDLIVEKNQFIDCDGVGVYNVQNVIVRDNTAYGIEFKVQPVALNACTGDILIERNIMYRTLDGIELISISASVDNPVIVRNNLVSGSNVLLNTGSVKNLNFAHNTLIGTSNSNNMVGLFGVDSLHMYNNIFYQQADYPLLTYFDLGNISSDYNCYYAPNGILGLNLTNYDSIKSLEDFQTKLTMEENGLNIDPNLVSDTTFQTLASELIDAGVPLDYVTDDIEGEPRSDGKPDIGADESALVSNLTLEDISTTSNEVNIDEGLTVTWRGRNDGETTFDQPWKDEVYLSQDDVLDEEDILLGFKINEEVLAPGDTYEFTKSFLVDVENAGDYQVLVRINADRTIFEDNVDNALAGPVITVNFTNRPDLYVSEIILPGKINSGSVLTVDWTVTNKGDQPTTENWYDYIYFSSDSSRLADHENLDPDLDFIAKIPSPVGLGVGESYTNTHQFKLPLRGSGNYYIKVITDFDDAQQELVESLVDNSTISELISIEQTPLADLEIISFTIPETAFSGERIDFSYTIKNVGTAKTAYDLWSDYIYITTDSIPNDDTFTRNWRKRKEMKHWKELEVEETFVVQENIELPYCEADTFYLYILMDVENEIVEISDDNNAVRANQSLIAVYKPSADFVIERFEFLDTNFETEQLIGIEYDIYNRGLDAASIFNDLQDAVYLSEDNTFDPEQDLKIRAGLFFDTLQLEIGDYITRQQTIKLPDSLFGDFYIIVNTDNPDEFCEVPYEDNNPFVSELINIQLAPQKDLLIENLEITSDFVAGDKMNITYDFSNDGPGSFESRTVIDSLYLVPDGESIHEDFYLYAKERELFNMAGETTIPEELLLGIPILTEPGDYKLIVKTDAADRVYEHEAEDNNITESEILTITRDDDRLPDLDIAAVNLPDQILSGSICAIDLQIDNLSAAKTNTDEWKYRIILMDEDLKSLETDLPVHFGFLEGNSSFTEDLELQIPNGISGDFKLAIQVDVNYSVHEYYKENNADTLDITIELSPWADLVPQNVTHPDTLTAGQLTTISWEILNSGESNTKADLMVDKLYLSEDNVLDDDDLLLHKMVLEDVINSNSSYAINEEFRVDPEYEGLYYLLLYSDASDQEYEHTGENNNLWISTEEIYVRRPAPIDLAPFPSSIILSSGYGRIDYGVINAGPNTAYGSWIDAAFLSEDEIWDPSDILMGYRTYNADEEGLAAGASYSSHILNDAGFVKPADYYVIIKSDVFNYMPEVNNGNNDRASELSWYIDMIAELTPDVVTDSVFRQNRTREHYYKLNTNVDNGYLLTLDGKNSNNSTELYYKVEDLPERGGNFDYKGANDFQELQQIIVPSKDSTSTDYILSFGDYIFGETMDYTILAEEKSFSIVNITPEFGGNEGTVVVDINGFDFSDSLRANLRDAEGNLEPAVHSIGISGSKARAHFNTNFIDPGVYDLVLQRLDRGDQTVLEDAFTVQDTSYTDYYMTVTGPDRVRRGTDFIAQVNFRNNGNINDYDVFILVAFYLDEHGSDAFSMEYLGDGISDELPEELQAFHPFNNDALIKDEKAYYFCTWMPVFAAQSSGQFTFKFNIDILERLNVSAQFFANPITEIHFTGNLDDLLKTRFMQDLEALLSNDYNGASNARVMNGECIDDPKVVEAMIWKGVRAHAQYVGGGIPSNRTDVAASLIEEGLKSIVDVEAHNRAEGVVNDLTDKPRDIVLNPTEKSSYDHLIKNLDNCLTPDIRQEIDRCLVAVGREEREDGRGYYTVYQNRCTQRPPKQPDPKWYDPAKEKAIDIVNAIDPNEILGPEGIGDPRYISTSEVLPYRINFENVAEASAAAQRVAIENELRDELNERNFRLDAIGWNDTIIQLPQAAYFSGKFDLGPDYDNMQLQLTAGLDPVNRRAFWRFQTIDPATGAPPRDPDAGFLPPNDSTGIGEGFVSYTIAAKSDLAGGVEVQNDAVIIFDQEKSLETNVWTNTIKGSGDIDSFVDPLPAETDTTRFIVSWQPNDDFNEFKPNIQDYTIFVAIDDGLYDIWQLNTSETSAIFTGEVGHTYQFYSVARTVDGVSEYTPTSADAVTYVKEPEMVTSLNELSIEERLKTSKLVVYPNPSSHVLNLAYEVERTGSYQMSIFNLSGKLIYRDNWEHSEPGLTFKTIGKTNQLRQGLYFIKLEGPEFHQNRKWIKE